MSADRGGKSCNVASGVSMDCVATNTSRFACARGAGQVAAKTGETKTGATRIAVAADMKPIGLGIVRAPLRSHADHQQRSSYVCGHPLLFLGLLLQQVGWAKSPACFVMRGLDPRIHLVRKKAFCEGGWIA